MPVACGEAAIPETTSEVLATRRRREAAQAARFPLSGKRCPIFRVHAANREFTQTAQLQSSASHVQCRKACLRL